MNNSERREELNYLATLYCPNDKEIILSRCPIEQEDEDGKMYDKYFNFLQTIYSMRDGLDELSPSEVMHIKQGLLDIAHEFRYPTRQILVLGE